MKTIQWGMDPRNLDWEGCANVRDLGGLPLPGGTNTLWRKVIRSDFPGQLTETGWHSLADAGVKTIIDLRTPAEVEKEPYAIPAWLAVQYYNLPIEKFIPEVSALIIKAQLRAEIYCIILDRYPDLIAAVFQGIAAASEDAVLIHCQAGKDRTGTIIGLLLDLAGVSHEWIAADYAESQIRLRALYEQTLAEAGSVENLGFWSRPTATAEGYLRFAGVSSPAITALKNKLVG